NPTLALWTTHVGEASRPRPLLLRDHHPGIDRGAPTLEGTYGQARLGPRNCGPFEGPRRDGRRHGAPVPSAAVSVWPWRRCLLAILVDLEGLTYSASPAGRARPPWPRSGSAGEEVAERE